MGVLSCSAQGLLLILCSGITPSGTWETMWSAGDWTCLGHIKTKCPTCCALSPIVTRTTWLTGGGSCPLAQPHSRERPGRNGILFVVSPAFLSSTVPCSEAWDLSRRESHVEFGEPEGRQCRCVSQDLVKVSVTVQWEWVKQLTRVFVCFTHSLIRQFLL